MKKKQKYGLLGKTINFLGSVKFAIYIFAILILFSMVGLIVQQEGSENYDKIILNLSKSVIFLKFFHLIPEPRSMNEVLSYGEKAYKILNRFGLTDIYHSKVFTTLLFFFSINLFLCTIKILPPILKYFIEPKIKFVETDIRMNYLKNFEVNCSIYELKDKLIYNLKNKFYSLKKIMDGEEIFLLFEKGKLGRLGVLITHISVFLILLGAIINSEWGLKGVCQLSEGKLSYGLKDIINYKYNPFGFAIKCEKNYITYYDNATLEEVYTELSVIKEGKKVLSKTIKANEALTYNGITFLQARFGTRCAGTIGNMESNNAVIDVLSKYRSENEIKRFILNVGEEFQVSKGVKARLKRIIPDFVLRGKEVVFRSEKPNKPAVQLEIIDGEKVYTTWLFKNNTDLHPFEKSEYKFRLIALADKSPAANIRAVYAPGIGLIWIGFGIMTIGIFIAFFVPHKRVWVKLDSQGVSVGGTTSKNKISFEIEMKELVSDLKRSLTC